VQFVPGEGEEIYAQGVDVNWHLSHCLHRVRMQGRAVRPNNRCDLCDGLNRPNFVVGHHDRYQRRIGPESAANVVRINQSVTINGHRR